ncbi:MAG TPA: ATP synthase F1 subunit gamma [Saprospiraceae bacterium]|nr:ATP synthase F1 subunit gamma [Saprospiraceae bacterium]
MGANLKEVRERIKSVISTQQITKAMKMVSAAKFRKAQQAIVQVRPYADRLNKMLANISANSDGDTSLVFNQEREVNNVLVVIITSSRGLAGAFNANVIKAAIIEIDTHFLPVYNAGNLTILSIGKKGNDGLRRRYPKATFITEHIDLISRLSYDNVAVISQWIMDEFAAKKFDQVVCAYSRFKNAAMQFAEVDQYLPIPKIESTGKRKSKADYIYEPDQFTLLATLIPNILQLQFHRFVLDTHASEHGARMTAMEKATDNAEELLKELKINYNKARQEAITNELSEIVGGAAALESN